MAITLDGTNGVTTPNLTVDTTKSTVQNGGSVSAPAYGIITGALGVNGTYVPAANTLGFVVGGAERGRFTANGLTFNGDTAAANALDDYEEGTWTPTLAGSSNRLGTWSSITGRYTKIGRVVFLQADITGSSMRFSATSGFQQISGNLPFAASQPSDSQNYSGTWSGNSVAYSSSGSVYLYNTTIYLHSSNSGQASSGVGGIGVTITYFTA